MNNIMNKIKNIKVFIGYKNNTWIEENVSIPIETPEELILDKVTEIINQYKETKFICLNKSKYDFFIDNSNGRLKEIITFSLTHPKKNTLDDCFNKLKRMCKHRQNTEISLYYDWAPMSLGWSITDITTGSLKITGGLIYHGSIDGIRIVDSSITIKYTNGWQIHT